jgi:hypothetical protein
MAPAVGIDTASIKDTNLKDLLDLLEGVRKQRAQRPCHSCGA